MTERPIVVAPATRRRSLKSFAATVGMTVVDWPVAETDPIAHANTPEKPASLQPPRPFAARNP